MNKTENQPDIILLPDIGNLITEKDTHKRRSIRITANFKHLFPQESTNFHISVNHIQADCEFEYRTGKSHYIHLTGEIFDALDLRIADSLLINKKGQDLNLITIRTLTLIPTVLFPAKYKTEIKDFVFVANDSIHIGYRNFDGKWYDKKSNIHEHVSHFGEIPDSPISRPNDALCSVTDSWNRLDAKEHNTETVLAGRFPFVLLYDHGEIVATDSKSYWFDSRGNTFPEIKHWIGVNIDDQKLEKIEKLSK